MTILNVTDFFSDVLLIFFNSYDEYTASKMHIEKTAIICVL